MEHLSFSRTDYSINDFYNWMKTKSLELSPSFQRRDVWSNLMKSYFIDTIIKGLPVPVIFLRERIDINTLKTIREVVDGQQRLRTILAFVDPGCLKDYNPSRDYFQVRKTHNPEIANKDFKDLTESDKQKILNYKFSVHVLPTNVDDPMVLQIFARINSTGVKLNPQELRNARYFGEFKNTMYELALEQLDRWRKWGIFKEQDIARMNEVQLTNDLVILIINGFTSKEQKIFNNTYSKYDEEFPDKKVVKRRFRVVMDTIEDLIGKDMSNSNFTKETIFYYLFTLLYDIRFSINSKLLDSRPNKLPPDIRNKIWKINSYFKEESYPKEVFEIATRRPTAVVRSEIFDFLKKQI